MHQINFMGEVNMNTKNGMEIMDVNPRVIEKRLAVSEEGELVTLVTTVTPERVFSDEFIDMFNKMFGNKSEDTR